MKFGVAALTLALAGCTHAPQSFQIRTPETAPAILAPRALLRMLLIAGDRISW